MNGDSEEIRSESETGLSLRLEVAIGIMASVGFLSSLLSVPTWMPGVGLRAGLPGVIYGVAVAIPFTWNKPNQFWSAVFSGVAGFLAFVIAQYVHIFLLHTGSFGEYLAGFVGTVVFGLSTLLIFELWPRRWVVWLFITVGLHASGASYPMLFVVWQTSTAAILGLALASRKVNPSLITMDDKLNSSKLWGYVLVGSWLWLSA